MIQRHGLIPAFLAAALAMVAFSTAADELQPLAKQPTASSGSSAKYLRIRRDEQEQPIALETAVTRYVSKEGAKNAVTVDLIGAVHVAEKEYYDHLNKLFTSYDVVLYELVAPEGTRIVPGQRRVGTNPVSFMQNMMKNVLKLQFQLECVDYTKPNLVHADMSPQEFSQSMKDRGESFLQMFVRILGQSMAIQAKQSNPNSDAEMLVALIAKDRAYRLKKLMAVQFENMEGQLSALNGPDGSTIITERNKKAFQILRQQIDGGKRRLAVFYGAGHLSDMGQRLESEFGLKRQSQRWLVAWSIVPEQPGPTSPAEQESEQETTESVK